MRFATGMNYFLLEPFPPLWNPLAGAQVNAGPLEDLIVIDKARLYSHVQEMAGILVILLSKQAHATATTVGDKWAYNFIKCHDQLKN